MAGTQILMCPVMLQPISYGIPVVYDYAGVLSVDFHWYHRC